MHDGIDQVRARCELRLHLAGAFDHSDRGHLDKPQEAYCVLDAFHLVPQAVVRGVRPPEDIDRRGRIPLNDVDQRIGIGSAGRDYFLHLYHRRGKGGK